MTKKFGNPCTKVTIPSRKRLYLIFTVLEIKIIKKSNNWTCKCKKRDHRNYSNITLFFCCWGLNWFWSLNIWHLTLIFVVDRFLNANLNWSFKDSFKVFIYLLTYFFRWKLADTICEKLSDSSEELSQWRKSLLSAALRWLAAVYKEQKDPQSHHEETMLTRLKSLLVGQVLS